MTEILNINNFSKIQTGSRPGFGFSLPAIFQPKKNNEQKQITTLPDNSALRVLPSSGLSLNAAQYTQMYQDIAQLVDDEGKKNLQILHQNKKLVSNKSNDGSTTIENLHKIISMPRAQDFDPKIIIQETLKTLADPYIITQDFGETPQRALSLLVDAENASVEKKLQKMAAAPINEFERKPILKYVNPDEINFRKGHTCPGASIEFDLADKKPAEFVRYIERLTSPERCVKSKIKYSNIADDLPAAISKLYDWKVDYKRLNSSTIEVTQRPDDNAFTRAVIQEYGRAKNSRSTIDSLLQSTFMQTGSAKTYNSLTDLRSEETGHGRGLNQEEGAFSESITDYDDGKDSITYMQLDDNLTKVLKYNFDPQTTEAMLTETLNNNKNIMVGFLTDVDEKGNLVTENGHEILLTGLVQDEKGEKYFRYNDTDDEDHYEPSYIPVKELIRTLHHANLPKSITKKFIPQQQDPRMLLIQDYWELVKQNKEKPVDNVQKPV